MSQQDCPERLRSHGGESAEEVKRLRQARKKYRKKRYGKAMRELTQIDRWIAYSQR